MSLVVDRRTVHFQADPAALAEVDDRRDAWLDQQLDLARLFWRIDRKGAFLPAGCASLPQLAARRGYDPNAARDLCRLGYALAAEPELEALLRANRIGFEAACQLGRIHADPALRCEGDRWLHWARFERLGDLRRRIRQRVETVRQGVPAYVPFAAHVTARTASQLARCRHLAAQKAGRMPTNGQLLALLAATYLLEHDVFEQGAGSEEAADASGATPQGVASDRRRWGPGSGTRRLPPTSERPGDRTIPAAVARALEERSGGMCEFGACDRPAVETCHLVPHAEGGAREVEDLVRGCHLHHKAYDAELIRFLGWTRAEDPEGAGLPVFQVAATHDILRPRPRPRLGSRLADVPGGVPAWMRRALGPRLCRRLAGATHLPEPEPPDAVGGGAGTGASTREDGHDRVPGARPRRAWPRHASTRHCDRVDERPRDDPPPEGRDPSPDGTSQGGAAEAPPTHESPPAPRGRAPPTAQGP